MSRRYVKNSRVDSLGKIIPEVVAVVSAKNQIEVVDDSQKYFKRNYLEAVRKIVPKFYFTDEQAISGTQVSFPNQLINSHILAVKNQPLLFPLSSISGDVYFSSLNSPEGLAPYFYKNQVPTQIDADDFNRNILQPLGVSINQFSSSGAFVDYVTNTLLPKIPSIHTGVPETGTTQQDLSVLTVSAFASDSSGTYKYLANNLGWAYFLNRSGPEYDVSTALPTLLAETIWRGYPLVLADNLNLFEEHLWRNEGSWSLGDRIVPTAYVSSVDNTDTFTSGTQLLDRLKTLNSVVYSPHFLDSPDSSVETAFTNFFNTSTAITEGVLIDATSEAGPLSRFLEAMSFSMADGVTEQAELNTLYDIGKCPQEFLELLGELIGWKFIGSDFDKWRVQLRNAVRIYKMKGTKRAIQYLMDTLFSVGVFNVTTSDTLSELWESYIPDVIYYSLATSSEAFKDFKTYTPELALQFGVPTYDPNSMHRNIQFLVDKIIWDLVREFPASFILGGKPFPVPQLLLEGVPYTGIYHIEPNDTPATAGQINFPNFYTGNPPPFDDNRELLELEVNENFLFNYRGRVYLVPPYEKRQYYTNTEVSLNMLERIEYYLKCYGVDKNFAKSVKDYLAVNTTQSLDPKKVINNFVLYTPEKTYPPNYSEILRDATKERTPDPVSLLSMWNGKSSHFLMSFDASSFDWQSQQLAATSKYGLTKVLRVMDQVLPAHAIPEVLLTISSVADGMDALSDTDCKEVLPNFTDIYDGSSTVTTGFATCAIDMVGISAAKGIPLNRFKRSQVENVNDVLLSGTGTFINAPNFVRRNSLRRRNYHNLLPENGMFTRGGRNNPGSLELSTTMTSSTGTFYTSNTGYIPLGYMPSGLRFREVSTRPNENDMGIGTLLDTSNLDPVWDVCMNLRSPSSVFGYMVSDTFASRAKQTVETSGCSTYGKRGSMNAVLYVMNKAHDEEKYLQASSIVSGYYEDIINGRTPTDTSSDLLAPTDFSAWYAVDPPIDVPRSMGNYLINKDGGDKSLNYYEHFAFGRPVQQLYDTYLTSFSGHGMANMYDLIGGPNLFSHAYGPLVYNSNLDIDGSGLEVSGYLSASAPTYEVNLAYYGGSGVLSLSGMNKKLGGYDLGTSAVSSIGEGYLTNPEFRNRHLVSSMELCDTSTAYTFAQHPTFSLFRFTRDSQSKYSYAKYLINNQILKYHRSQQLDTLPRLRINIDPSDPTDPSRNFLEPNHEYEVTVKAHNLDSSSTEVGGQTLGLWVHTQPTSTNAWSYVPFYDPGDCNAAQDTWELLETSSLEGPQGINLATNKAIPMSFTLGNLEEPLGTGEGNNNPGNPLMKDTYDYRCYEPLFVERVLKGSDAKAITNISTETLEELKFRFSTYNRGLPSDIPPHSKDTKYTLDLFALQGHLSKFIVIENIEIKDLTLYNKSVIQTKYGDAQLDLSDLKTVFRFFKSISTGLASRNSEITRNTMEAEGGSRLNYRSNSNMFPTGGNTTYNQLTEVRIHEG